MADYCFPEPGLTFVYAKGRSLTESSTVMGLVEAKFIHGVTGFVKCGREVVEKVVFCSADGNSGVCWVESS